MSTFNLKGLKEIFSDKDFSSDNSNAVLESYERDDVSFLDLPIPKNEKEYYAYFNRYEEEFVKHNEKYKAISESCDYKEHPIFEGIDWNNVTDDDIMDLAKQKGMTVSELLDIGMDSIINNPYFQATTRLNTVTVYSGMGVDQE